MPNLRYSSTLPPADDGSMPWSFMLNGNRLRVMDLNPDVEGREERASTLAAAWKTRSRAGAVAFMSAALVPLMFIVAGADWVSAAMAGFSVGAWLAYAAAVYRTRAAGSNLVVARLPKMTSLWAAMQRLELTISTIYEVNNHLDLIADVDDEDPAMDLEPEVMESMALDILRAGDSSDPEYVDSVAADVLKSAQARTGVEMDVEVLHPFDKKRR